MTTETLGDLRLTLSPTIGAIAADLAKAQAEMGHAGKDGRNPHFGNKYATLASVREACTPLHRHGIAIVQPPAHYDGDGHGVCVRTILLHTSGEWIAGELAMPATKQDAQGYGSALSYARRYCLAAVCGIATDDDDAEGAVRHAPQVPTPPKSAPQIPQPSQDASPGRTRQKSRAIASAQTAGEKPPSAAANGPTAEFVRLKAALTACKSVEAYNVWALEADGVRVDRRLHPEEITELYALAKDAYNNMVGRQ